MYLRDRVALEAMKKLIGTRSTGSIVETAWRMADEFMAERDGRLSAEAVEPNKPKTFPMAPIEWKRPHYNAEIEGWNSFFTKSDNPFPGDRGDLRRRFIIGRNLALDRFPKWHEE